MARESLEEKASKAILSIEKKVSSIYAVLMDVSAMVVHALEQKFDYYTLPKGKIDYESS